MLKLPPHEFDVPTYHFNVHMTIGISYIELMFRVHNIQRNGVGPSNYFSPLEELSNGLLSDPNGYHMQMLRPQEVDVPTYHFMVHKIVEISSCRVMFRVKCNQINGVFLFSIILFSNTFPMISWTTQMEICANILCSRSWHTNLPLRSSQNYFIFIL